MVKVIKGCLIKTEPSIKEIIMRVAEHAVINEVNNETLFIKSEFVAEIKQKVDKIIQNTARHTEHE